MSVPDVKTANFAVSEGYFIYYCDPTNGAIIATLPLNPWLNETHTFQDCTGAASPSNPIGIDGNGHLINGAFSMPQFIQVSEGFGTIRFNGESWSVIG